MRTADDARLNPMPGDALKGPRKDEKVISLTVLRGKPRLLISDGQFTFRLAIAQWRTWAPTAEVVKIAQPEATPPKPPR